MSVVLETQAGDSHYEELVDFISQLISSEAARLTESDPQAAAALKEKDNVKNFSSSAKKALREHKYDEFIKQILSAAEFYSKDHRYYTSVFQVLASICHKQARSEQEPVQLAQPIVDFAKNNTNVSLSMRFRALAVLFNIFTNYPNFRYTILKAIFELALSTKKISIVLQHLIKLQNYCDELEISVDKEVEIYKLALKMVDVLDEKNNAEKFEVYYNFLERLNKKFDKNVFNQNQAEIRGIINNILKKFPRNIDFNRFLSLKIVKEFETVDKDLYELLNIAINGDVETYHKWKAGHADYGKKNGLDENTIEERVTLTTFYRIAESNKTIKLDSLAKQLKLEDESEAEFWVIKAIQKGELLGKIDETEGVLNIENVNQQSFHSAEWKELETKLASFKKQFQTFADVVKQGVKI